MAPSAISSKTVSDVSFSKNVQSQPEQHVYDTEEPTPLEAISHGPIVMPGIPTFSTFREHRQHILIHMAATFRDFAHKGFTEGMSGHISVRDPEFEDYIWMNPLGRHFGLLTAGDMMCLNVHTGAIVGGNRTRPANKAGFLIHSQIHIARPDVHAICHAHTIAGRAWSAFSRPLEMLNQDICNFYNAIAVYAAYGGIVFAEEEGRNIARALGPTNKAAILRTHGLLTLGSTVDEAGFLFGLLERGCEMQLMVEAAIAGNPELKKTIISDEEAAYNFRMASEMNALYREAQPDLEYVVEAISGGWEKVSKGVEDMRIFGANRS